MHCIHGGCQRIRRFNGGANSYRIAVATNPKVINRRKYPRMPVANACTVTLKIPAKLTTAG